ncbi:MAG: glycosyltransferase family 4 protein [Saprospiraceae bacterium]|nr:glycosyltransferase family 4 protein [Saprospiraceae bacterium]
MNNICFWNSHRFWGGGEKLHLEYAEGFRRNNHRCLIATDPDSPLKLKAQTSQLPVFDFRIRKFDFLNPYKIYKICQFFKKTKTDTLIFSSSQDMKAAGLGAYFAGVERIVYLRGLAVPVKNSFINRFYFEKIITHIVANSLETKSKIIQYLKSKNIEAKIKIVYHGIDPIENHDLNFSASDITKKNQDPVVLGSAGRLTKQKGFMHLLEIANILHKRNIPFQLKIAGTGELETDLKNRILELQLDQFVELSGFVENMNKFMQDIDIFVLCSEWEGFGFVLVEAMMHQKPVVAFDISSNPEIVLHGETGFLANINDYHAFADHLQSLIENRDLRIHMGQTGRKRAMDQFLLEDSVINLEKALSLA